MKQMKPRIEFLKSTYGNSSGDIVTLFDETEGEVYYYDGFGRSCYLNKDEEGDIYRYIPAGVRLRRVV